MSLTRRNGCRGMVEQVAVTLQLLLCPKPKTSFDSFEQSSGGAQSSPGVRSARDYEASLRGRKVYL